MGRPVCDDRGLGDLSMLTRSSQGESADDISFSVRGDRRFRGSAQQVGDAARCLSVIACEEAGAQPARLFARSAKRA